MSFQPKGTQIVDLGNNQSVSVGGIVLAGTVQHQASSGQNAPEYPVESGMVLTTRVGPEADEGTLTAWVDSTDLPSLTRLRDRREPVRITTPEKSYPTCIVKDVSRNLDGEHAGSYNVTLEWKQIFIGTTGTSDIQAVTSEGPKTSKAGSDGGNPGLVPASNKNVSNGPNTGKGSGKPTQKDSGGGVLEGVGDWADGVSKSIQDWAGRGGSGTVEQASQVGSDTGSL